MGCNTFGKCLGVGQRGHNALLDIAAVHGVILNLGTIFWSFVGRFLQADLEPKHTRKRKFYDKNAIPISFGNLQLL